MTTVAWQQNGEEDAENVIPNHYIICNDTREVLRFGQVECSSFINKLPSYSLFSASL